VSRCLNHSEPVDYTWTEKVNGKSSFNCPVCREKKCEADKQRHDLPLVKFSQTWHRDRPLTRKERAHKPLKPQ
jgi:hypothetical protein